MENEVLEKLWIYLMVDYKVAVRGKYAIIVICNRLSKMTHFVAIIEGTSEEGLFRNNMWKLYKLPKCDIKSVL